MDQTFEVDETIFPSRTILVADDELDQDEVQEWIDAADLKPPPILLFAQDKHAIFKLLKNNSDSLPHVVFLDLNLKSRKHGLEALKELKNSDSYIDIPVVMYSQSSDETDIRETSALHANSYLTKGTGQTQGTRFADAMKYWLTLDCLSGGSK